MRCTLTAPRMHCMQVLNDRPYGRREPMISGLMWMHMLGQAGYQIAVLFVLLYAAPSIVPRYSEAVDPDRKHSLSLLFNSFIFMQARACGGGGPS